MCVVLIFICGEVLELGGKKTYNDLSRLMTLNARRTTISTQNA